MSHTDKNIKDISEVLKKGYLEMSSINLEEANQGIEFDNEALQIQEENLTECE